MDETTVTVEEAGGTTERLVARTKVWAAGMTASPLGRLLAEQSGAETRPVRPGPGPAGLLAARATPRSSWSAT